MPDRFYLGENAQSFQVSPQFDNFDMVILNIDDQTYVSSPRVWIDQETWESNRSRQQNGTYTFTYNTSNGRWVRNNSNVTLSSWGIGINESDWVVAPKAGDTITVNRFKDDDSGELSITIELTRSGRCLEAKCPLSKSGDRNTLADNILQKLSSYAYQPFAATSAEVSPLMELGDAITAHGVFTGMYQQDLNFEPLMSSDIGAPAEEETEHEYEYETAEERKYSRRFADVSAELSINASSIQLEVQERIAAVSAEASARTSADNSEASARQNADNQIQQTMTAQFTVQASQISAKVSKEGGTSSSFAWALLDDHFSLTSNNTEVFRVDSSGATVRGTITATSGYIGNGSNGFTITANAIYNGTASMNSQITPGVYIGTDGISIGGGKFKVDSQGNLSASSGTFTGAVYANQIQVGGTAGYISGSQIGSETIGSGNLGGGSVTSSKIGGGAVGTSKLGGKAVTSDKLDDAAVVGSKIAAAAVTAAAIAANAVGTSELASGVNTSLGYADYAHDVFSSTTRCNYLHTKYLDASGTVMLLGRSARWATVKDGDGATWTVLVD